MYLLKLIILILFLSIYSYSDEQFHYLKFENTDKDNAILKVEKKNKLYEYVIKYKFEKHGYINDNDANINFYDRNNEDKQSLIFANSIYINDNIWMDFNFNYENSLKKSIDDSMGLLSENKIYEKQSLVKFYFKPNSILTTNLSFESKNRNSDLDLNTSRYKNIILDDTNKISFNTHLRLDFIDIYTKVYQLNSDYNKFYKDIDSDYMKNKDNITRGIELTFEKDFFESYLISTTFFIANNDYDYIYKKHTSNKKHRINSLSKGLNFSIDKSISDNFKVVTAAKISQNKIKDSNEKYLIGNNVKNKANTQLALNLEYKINKTKLFSRFTHMSSRYANDKNSKKLDPYTIGTIGSSFYTKVKNRDIKFDFNIKNIFNKKYYIDSDTQGDLRNYFFNMIMSF